MKSPGTLDGVGVFFRFMLRALGMSSSWAVPLQLQVIPLPAELSQIDAKRSQPWLGTSR
jgi:hypothetical protein